MKDQKNGEARFKIQHSRFKREMDEVGKSGSKKQEAGREKDEVKIQAKHSVSPLNS